MFVLLANMGKTVMDALDRHPIGWLRLTVATVTIVALGLVFAVAGVAIITQSFWFDQVIPMILLGVIELVGIVVAWVYYAVIVFRNVRYQKKERLRKKNGVRLREQLLHRTPF